MPHSRSQHWLSWEGQHGNRSAKCRNYHLTLKQVRDKWIRKGKIKNVLKISKTNASLKLCGHNWFCLFHLFFFFHHLKTMEEKSHKTKTFSERNNLVWFRISQSHIWKVKMFRLEYRNDSHKSPFWDNEVNWIIKLLLAKLTI